jgi:hypothetical protein
MVAIADLERTLPQFIAITYTRGYKPRIRRQVELALIELTIRSVDMYLILFTKS